MQKRLPVFSLLLLLTLNGVSDETLAEDKSWLDMGKGMLDSALSENKETAAIDTSGLNTAEMIDGLKEALKVSTETVVAQLGAADGFNADQAIRIPLPSQLQKVKGMLSQVGMGSMMNDLETRLNRAAEQATPKAKTLFWDAIKEMDFEDAKRIYSGPDDAATQYLREKMNAPLSDALRPIIDESLSEVGAVKAYDSAMGRYQDIPFVPNVKADLTDHTLAKGMDGIFYYLAQEEAAIRKNPVKRTTELLRKVFGG